MKKSVSLLIGAVLCALPMWGEMTRGYSTQTSGAIDAIVDSIDFRDDLTRVYARLKGVPHTSSRIDNITMKVESGVLPMTDLDGVDAERWFQWEDSPYIPVEIDFAPVKKRCLKPVFRIYGPKGDATWVVLKAKKR